MDNIPEAYAETMGTRQTSGNDLEAGAEAGAGAGAEAAINNGRKSLFMRPPTVQSW